MNRRDFLKTGIFVSTTLLVNPLKLLAICDDSVVIKRKLTGNDFVDLFYSELDLYPKRSVAHSIYRVETLLNPNNFESIVRGMSLGKNNKAKYFCFEIDKEKFMVDINHRRQTIEDVLTHLRVGWKNSKTRWIYAGDQRSIDFTILQANLLA